jgi:hypothetical protein
MRKYYWEAPKNAPKAKTGNYVAKAQHGFFNKLETTDKTVLPETKALSNLERARLQRAKSKADTLTASKGLKTNWNPIKG